MCCSDAQSRRSVNMPGKMHHVKPHNNTIIPSTIINPIEDYGELILWKPHR
uniref:Uncharacterized protein n=1 Tax=Arundo donax TaxID=35708 RepID=A0A0A8Z5X2_ARUDO